MPSIFDSLADTTEAAAPAKTGSIFDSLEGPQAATAPTTSARPGEIPRDTSLKAPPASSQDASTLGKLVRGQGVLETGADAADIVLGGLPAIILGSIGEVTQRASSIFDGRGYREGAKAGAEFSRSMGEKFGRPIFDNLVATGLLDPKTRSVPMQAMDKIGGWLEHAATVFEADTGLPREDYLASINGFMAAMGVKGAQAMTQGALNKAKARGTKSAWDTALERMDAEEQLARGSEAEGAAAKLTTPVADAAKIRLMARPEAGATRTREQARKDARAAFSTPEAGDQAGLVDRQAGYREELAAQRAVLQDRFPPSGERTGSRDAVDLTLTGKGTPVTYTDNQLGVVHPSPLGTGKRLDVVPRPPLETALEKVKSGRLFDMTMEERLAVKNSVDITDPKVITAAAVGATGLGLAMAYEPSAEEAVLAIGAGALLRRGGEGLPMRELLAKPEATPLGALLEASAYTTSTLEKLAEASPGKFEFKKSAVEQLLKREGVTKHERDLMVAAMAEVPRDTVTAKELMVGLKLATKDFELTSRKSDSYADYGLERIDRDPGIHRDLAQQFGVEPETNPLEATTRVYRSPLELGSNNHFNDPNYFAHTRSFTEDGVRHVVELQSDLAQKAGKVLKPEERAALQAEYNTATEKRMLAERELTIVEETGKDLHGNSTSVPTARRYLERAFVLEGELRAKLTKAGSADKLEPISPMLKDWHKRLVREELADAARNLEPSVRFATADTVAKVEGWPEQASLKDQIAYLQEQAELARGLKDEWEAKGYERQIEKLLAAPPPPRFRPEHQGIYDRYSRDVEKFLRQLGGKPYTDSAGHTWLEVPLGEQQKTLPGGGARTQVGGVDPALAKAVGLVGGSAALAAWLSRDKDKVKHAAMTGILTGLGLLAHSRVPRIRSMVASSLNGVQQLVGNLSTDKAVSAPLLRQLTEHARLEMKGIHDSGRRIAPLLEIASKLPNSVQADLNTVLHNGRTSDIVAAIGKAATPGLLKAWNEVQAELKALGTQMKDLHLIKDLRQDYFPRIVNDLPGLLNAIGKTHAIPLQRALDAATKAAGGFLDDAERAAVVNKFLEKNLRTAGGQGKPSFFKRRTIDNVTIDLAPYYVEPLQVLPLYVASAVRAIERAKFFGKDAVRDPTTGKLHLEGSIGNVVEREIASGQMTPENFTRLRKLLETRFGPAYEAPAAPLRAYSQITNIALLGNVFSGMMNLSDIGQILLMQGPLATAAAVVKKYHGTHKITAADVGMADRIMEEFVYGTREPIHMRIPLTERTVQISLAKALDKTFKFSGFKMFDQVMKEVHLNAAFENFSRMSRTKSGEAKILKRYKDYFTTDTPQLLADLRAGAKTKLTTELAFRELSDAQPTTKIEMPQFALAHPNARFAYTLKSFSIKQLNLLKKRGIDEIAKGNVREGMGFVIRYMLVVGAAGATMDWVVKSLLGRDADTDWGVIPFNALKNMGISEYAINKAREGKGKEAILAATLPPMDPILNIVTADPKAASNFPLVGRLVYDRAMDGAEKANAAKKLAEKKKRRDAARTPEERRDLEQRALERRKELVRER